MATYGTVLDALADGTRRDILEQLARGPAPVSTIAAKLPVSRPAVSQHLRVLYDAGLVDYEQQGTRNVYRLDTAGVEALRKYLDRMWGDVLGAFERHARAQHGKKGKR